MPITSSFIDDYFPLTKEAFPGLVTVFSSNKFDFKIKMENIITIAMGNNRQVFVTGINETTGESTLQGRITASHRLMKPLDRITNKDVDSTIWPRWEEHWTMIRTIIKDHIKQTDWIGLKETHYSEELRKQAKAHYTGAKAEAILIPVGMGVSKIATKGGKVISGTAKINVTKPNGGILSSQTLSSMAEKITYERIPGRSFSAGISTNRFTSNFIEVDLGAVAIKVAEEKYRDKLESMVSGTKFEAFDPFDFQSESTTGKVANKVADVVTDFVPVVGQAKSGGKIIANVILGIAKTRMADRLLIDIEQPINNAIKAAKSEVKSLLIDDIDALSLDELISLCKTGGYSVVSVMGFDY